MISKDSKIFYSHYSAEIWFIFLFYMGKESYLEKCLLD